MACSKERALSVTDMTITCPSATAVTIRLLSVASDGSSTEVEVLSRSLCKTVFL